MGRSKRVTSVSLFVAFFLFLSTFSWAQHPAPLVTQSVDDQRLTLLRGNTHPLAQRKFDQGAAPASMPMHRMMLVLQRSPQQEHSLITLLDSQQDKSSPNYHQWLTPDQFGQQFGAADADVQTVTSWLQLHGFQVTRVSKGKTIVEFDGTAGQVQQAFHTSIHSYVVNGEQHWANASDPQIPAALAPVVAGPMSLNNFFPKPQNRFGGIFSKSKTSPKLTPVNPQFTFPCFSNSTCFGVVPYDFATIYNVLPLWNAGIDGTGQTIAIVGQTNINIQDVRNFRSLFGLPAHDPNIILNGPDPGIGGDEGEADIDVQWSGAVAKGATIDFVVSESTETTAGIDLSAEYIIDNNLAPVVSESYGGCELAFGTAGNQFYNALWEQAAAQGITVMISTGDSGSAGCDQNSGTAAQFGLAVNGIASTPFNVAVGGTDFNDALNPQLYWGSVNDPTTQESAVSYIPETTWNDSCTNGLLASFGYSTNPETNCNNGSLLSQGLGQAVGGSGGASNCTTNSQQVGTCSGGYNKPSWQSNTGVNDGKRDLPDVSLFASNGFVGSYYIVCQSDLSPSGMCDITSPFTDLAGYGGTSVASPAFTGIMALVNQQNGRQGNANYVLYKLAAQQTAANCNSSNGSGSSCMFNDVTSGTIAMPCVTGSPNCTTSTAGHQFGILSGYATTSGYDLATGLGTVNAANLVNNWGSVTFTPSATTLSLSPTSGLTHGQSVTATISVSPSAATGNVSLVTSTGKGIAAFGLTQASKTTSALPGGTYTVHAHYAGDGTYAASDSAPVSVTVAKENSTTAVSMITFNSQGIITNSHATTAPYGSPYILRMDVTASSGVVCGPLANCPTGTLAVTDNGSPLDPTFFNGILNSLGYTEDQPVQLPGGTNAVVANYPGDSSFNSSSANTTLTITPATTSMSSVSYTPSSVSSGVPFTLSTAVQTSSSGLSPSGAVKFFGNGTQLPGTVVYTPTAGSASGNASLLAQLTTTVSAGGNYALTASYAGDGNYSPSSATGPTLPVDTDFSLPQPLASITIASPGGSGQTMLTITGQSAYAGTVNLSATSCTALPAGAHCSFSPASVTGTGSTTLTVTTTAPSAAAKRAGLAGANWWMGGSGMMAFGVVLLGGPARKRWPALLGLAVFMLLLFLPACGGGSSGGGGGGGSTGTPVGNYAVTVTATSGSLSHSTTFMLIVQ